MRHDRFLGILLAALGFFCAGFVGAQAPSTWVYHYYKQVEELSFYPLEIVLYDPTPPGGLAPPPGRRQVLLPNGDVAMLEDLGDGWAILDLSGAPSGDDPEGYALDLIDAYATDPTDDVYAGPVFGDASLRMAVKTVVHVGFEAGVPQATVDAVLQAAGLGTVLESDWIRPNIFRTTGDMRSGVDVLAAANALAMDPGVRFATVNWLYMGPALADVVVSEPPAPLSSSWVPWTSPPEPAVEACVLPDLPPNDPFFHASWALAGNNGFPTVTSPGFFPEVHAISGVDANGERMHVGSSISNLGADVAFSGPAQLILTTDLSGTTGWSTGGAFGDDYVHVSGTSFASPMAAAIAAMVFVIRPDWTAEDVWEVMKRNALDLGDPGRDDVHGDGFLQAQATLEYARDSVFLDGFENGNDDVTVPELCFPIPAGNVQYYWRADVYMDASAEFFLCSINYALYDHRDCSDSFAFIVGDENSFPWVRTPNQWEHLSFDGDADFHSVGFRAVRPVMGKLADLGSDDACVLDNAYFEMVPLAATTIPAVSPVGLVVLAALLVAAGLVVLRRLSPG